MDKATWRQRLSYLTLFIPFRLYLLLFIAGILLAYWWTSYQKPVEESAFAVVLALLIKVAAIFILAVLVLSFLTVFIPYIFFYWNRNRKKVQVRVRNSHDDTRGQLLQRMEMSVAPLLRPAFGFLKYRFVYDGNQLSPKFSLAPLHPQKKIFQTNKEGWYFWPLPTIREYEVDKLLVYFEDIFQFFSFNISVRVNQSFFTKPRISATPEEAMVPRKTEEETVRIEELRKVQGEYLSYKNFEDNDDVRRIVWKIYAKSGDLVVRTQEIFDPFASHTWFYCSYFDAIGAGDAAMMQTRGLTYFKNACWSVYEQLKKQGADVRYIPDQEISASHINGKEQQVEYSIAVSEWQQHNNLHNYVQAKDVSVLCVSSLADVDDLAMLLEKAGGDLTVVYVRLRNSIRRVHIGNWIRWLFLQEEKDKDKTGMMKWRMSAAKRKLRENEKKIAALLKNTEAKVIVI
jgi:hypothetical protein